MEKSGIDRISCMRREEKVLLFLGMGHIEGWEDVLPYPGSLTDLYSYSQRKDLPFHV